MASDKDKDSLLGFEEFLSYTQEKIQKAQTPQKMTEESFKLLTFLESEYTRLNKILNLLDEKTNNSSSYPQDINLLIAQETHNITLKSELIKSIQKKESYFNQNMEILFKSFFKKN